MAFLFVEGGKTDHVPQPTQDSLDVASLGFVGFFISFFSFSSRIISFNSISKSRKRKSQVPFLQRYL
jgi:hypothetical protein